MIDLVTGGSGFLGSHVVNLLLQRGRRVRVLDIDPDPPTAAGVDRITGSVRDPAVVAAAMQGVERVFHIAGNPHLWAPRKDDFTKVNLGGTRIILAEAARQRVERLVYTSTAAILFRKRDRTGSIIAPTLADMPGAYCRSKFLAEQEALAAAEAGMPVVIVNPTLPIGPGDRHLTPPTRMILDFINGATPAFMDCTLNMIHVEDVALGHLRAAEAGMIGQRYVLGGGTHRLVDILGLIQEITGVPMPRLRVPYAVALIAAAIGEAAADRMSGKPPRASREGVRLTRLPINADLGRPIVELGVTIRPLAQALMEAIRWLVEHGHVRRPLPALRAQETGDLEAEQPFT